jgi:predicted ATPase
MRIVITGGPSVGKTTIVSALQKRGFPVVHEQATKIIKEGVFLPWVDRASFQSEVLRRQLEEERKVEKQPGTLFLDRGLFDGEAYYIYDKLDIPKAFSAHSGARYSLALLVEELPFFENNEVRRENIAFSREISKILEHCYASRGVKVIRVPAMPPDERLNFVLAAVADHSNQLSARISLIEGWTDINTALSASIF